MFCTSRASGSREGHSGQKVPRADGRRYERSYNWPETTSKGCIQAVIERTTIQEAELSEGSMVVMGRLPIRENRQVMWRVWAG